MLLETVYHVGVDDPEPEVFAVDSSAGKLLEYFCQVEQVRIILGSFGGGDAQLHDDINDQRLCSSSDVCDGWMLALPYPVVLQILYPTKSTGSPFLLGMCSWGFCLTSVSTVPFFVIDKSVCVGFSSK